VFVLCGGQAYQDLDGLGWPRPAVVFFFKIKVRNTAMSYKEEENVKTYKNN
jgi:hypothetical protein